MKAVRLQAMPAAELLAALSQLLRATEVSLNEEKYQKYVTKYFFLKIV